MEYWPLIATAVGTLIGLLAGWFFGYRAADKRERWR